MKRKVGRCYAFVNFKNGKKICKEVNPNATWLYPLIAMISTVGIIIIFSLLIKLFI